MKPVTILDALDDRKPFGGVLRDASRAGMARAFWAALFGLPMTKDEAEEFRSCTGRVTLTAKAFVEAWLVCGRRAGKSFILALIVVFSRASWPGSLTGSASGR